MLDLFALERAALVRAMRHAAPDLVHAHWQYEYAWAAIESGLPHLVTCHDAPWRILALYRDAYRFGRLLMARHVMRRARHLTAVSPYLRDVLRPMARTEIAVVPNPLPRMSVSDSPHRAKAATTPRVLMILNGWSPQKNPERGLLALRRLHTLHPQAELHVAGPDFGADQRGGQWAATQGIAPLIRFHGALPYRAMQQLLATMDVLLHPALEESFGMTVAEAMSHGIPVVAGAHSGAVPWVCGDAGRLVDVTSVDAMARAVDALLRDDAAYARCSAAGRARAEHSFSAAAVADAFEMQYRRALEASHERSPA